MTCRELADFIADYLAGELAPDQRYRFDAHVAVCPDCIAYLDQYSRSLALAAESDAELGSDVPAELVQAIIAARHRARE